MRNKRILVTGGSGFLGSNLCEKLLDLGNEVICVDNLFSGQKRNIYHFLENPKFEFIRHDVCFPLYLEIDLIYNLACPASPIHYQHDPVQTTKTSVYGDPTVHPRSEKYWGNLNPIGTRLCFDWVCMFSTFLY